MVEEGSTQQCPGCFEQKEERSPVCPHCGYDETQQRSPLVLPHRSEIGGRYLIGRVLGKPGSFGITYLALNVRLRELVAIKEYLPRDLAARDTDHSTVVPHSADEAEQFQYGLDRFLKEARMLAQFDHANIVGVRDFFEANETAYLVMEYYEGKTLKRYLSEQPEGRMEPENATEVMLRVLDGLREVHAEGYLHRDVKPGNIYLTKEGRPILIDFGAARLALGERSRSLSVVMTEGYAPYEQYHRKGDQGPWTDIYGCGATLYRMVTGEAPPPAAERVVEDDLRPPSEVNPSVPEGLGRAIEKALATGNKERPQSAEAFQERLRMGLSGDAAPQRLEQGGSDVTREREKDPVPSGKPGRASREKGKTASQSPSGGNGIKTGTEQGIAWKNLLLTLLGGGLLVGAVLFLSDNFLWDSGSSNGSRVMESAITPPEGWRGTRMHWWKQGVDTSKVFPNFKSLTTMKVIDEPVNLRAGGTISQEEFNAAIKRSLIKLYRNNPKIVDSLFEKYAAPELEDVDLSGEIVNEEGQLKPEVLNRNQKRAYVAVTEYFREPQRKKSPNNIIWPDSLRSEEYTGIVKIQAHLGVEGEGMNATATADAVEVLSGPHPTLNRISMKATTQAVWRPAYLLKKGSWIPVEGWVRFNVPFQMR